MKTFVTSDLHFGHDNIRKFCPTTRGHFKDVSHMNAALVQQWNSRVSTNDEVYILGDVAFMQAHQAVNVLAQLNGTKHLIKGNHDHKNLTDPLFRKCFATVRDYFELRYNGHFIVMSHYPILEWNRMHRGALHFYGHVHGNTTGIESYRCCDVGFDATGQVVTLIDDAIARICNNVIKAHH